MAGPYDVMITLTCRDNVSPVLRDIARLSMLLTGNFEKLSAATKTAIGGSIAVFGGAEAIKVMWALAKGSDDLLDKQNQMLRLGVAQNDVLKITNDYYGKIDKAIPTASASQWVGQVKEMIGITGLQLGGLEEAQELSQKALRMDALLANTMGEKSHGTGSEFYKLMRSAEMAGIVTDKTKRDKFADEMYSYILAFQGKLKPDDVMTMARRGGTSWMNLVAGDAGTLGEKNRALGAFSVLSADVGGQKAGTAMQTLQQLQLGTAVMSKQQAKIWEDAGLLDMSKAHPTGFGGGKLQLDPGALKGSLEDVGNLPKWIEEVIRPALMKAAGGDHNLYESLLGKAMPNRNAAGMAEMLGDGGFLDQRIKDLGIALGAWKEGNAYNTFINDDPKGVEAAYEAQKKSMFEAIGSPIMQAAIPIMKSMTAMFEAVGAFAIVNPGAITAIAEVISAVATLAVVGGTLAILKVAIAGLGGLPLVATAAAIGAFGYALFKISDWAATQITPEKTKATKDRMDALFGMTGNQFLASLQKGFKDAWANLTNGKGWFPNNPFKDFVEFIDKAFNDLGHSMMAALRRMIDDIKSLLPGGAQLPRPGGHPGEAPGDNVQHGSLVPPSAEKPVTINNSIMLDGRKLASIVTNQMVASTTFPTSASGADGRGQWLGPSAYATENG
jgi:hypothetical protein